MKTKNILFIALLAAFSLSSCSKSPKADLKTDVDTLSYIFGTLNAKGLTNEVLQTQLNIDTAKYLDDFFKGVAEGMKEATDAQAAYYKGLEIGKGIVGDCPNFENYFFEGDTTKKLSKEIVLAGFLNQVSGDKNQRITPAQADSMLQAIHTQKTEAIRVKNVGEGEAFLAENKTKEGVQTTASGLQYKVIKAGNGAKPQATDKVKVNYRGKLLDGSEFDSSYSRNQPAEFAVNQVIPGWTEALQLMPVGSSWEVYIPYNLAYGEQGAGRQIPPYSTLVFEVELLSIEK